ncbi:MAG: hypothetical protein LBQ88_20510 [Treponema sp.]|jgi:hypothetical protein|nr:hypothetical protein [Treponema sp.]
MDVIADKVKFLDAINVGDSIFQYTAHSIKAGLIFAAVIFALGFFSNALFVVAVVLVLVLIFWKSYNNNKSHRSRSLYNGLNVLGETVADVVFVPLLALAMYDGSIATYGNGFINRQMREWGYTEEYIQNFISDKTAQSVASLILRCVDIDKILSEKFHPKKGEVRISSSAINKKDLCRKSFALCEELGNKSGVVDTEKQKFLADLRSRMKV